MGAAILRKPTLPRLEEVKEGFAVFHRPATKTLPFWGKLFVEQFVLRAIAYANRKWGWTNDLEGGGFCTTKDLAMQAAAIDNPDGKRIIIHPMPVNQSLPIETCQFGDSICLSKPKNNNIKLPMKAVAENEIGEARELAKNALDLTSQISRTVSEIHGRLDQT